MPWNLHQSYRSGPPPPGGGGGGMMGLPQIYSDSWEGFSNGADISGTNMSWGANNPHTIKASTIQARTGSKSMLLPFGPSPRQTIELDGDFSAFGTDYREVEFQYYLYWPTNFRHTDSPSSNNNKFFRIWPDLGTGRDNSYNGISKLGCSMELAARGDTQYCDIASEWTTLADDSTTGFTARGGIIADFVTPSDYGTWTKINWYVRAATSLGGAGRAYLKMWKNNSLIIDQRPDNYDASSPQNYHYLYLFGARNTDDDLSSPNLDVYLDDLSVFAAV